MGPAVPTFPPPYCRGSFTLTAQTLRRAPDEKISWVKSIPFFAVHAMCLFAFYTGVTWKLVLVCIGLYYLRMWAITAAYHRYFSHRSFKTSRAFQFILALIATTSAQKGVLWWAAHHRHHHRESDQEADVHSPTLRGFWWSHVGWILCTKYEDTRFESIKDFAQYPELRFLNRFHLLPPIALGVLLFVLGGFPMLVWGLFISTVVLWHGTFTINSLSHVFGSRRYKTTDTSRNNFLLALITCGEGWHNNHHYHQNTANQGWFWWEIDLTYYSLKVLSWLGLVWDLRVPSEKVKYAHQRYTPEQVAALKAEARGFSIGRPAAARIPTPGELVRGAMAAADALPQGAAGANPLRR